MERTIFENYVFNCFIYVVINSIQRSASAYWCACGYQMLMAEPPWMRRARRVKRCERDERYVDGDSDLCANDTIGMSGSERARFMYNNSFVFVGWMKPIDGRHVFILAVIRHQYRRRNLYILVPNNAFTHIMLIMKFCVQFTLQIISAARTHATGYKSCGLALRAAVGAHTNARTMNKPIVTDLDTTVAACLLASAIDVVFCCVCVCAPMWWGHTAIMHTWYGYP